MKIKKLTAGMPEPKKGDLLLVQGTITKATVVPYKVALTKTVEGRLEVILHKGRNVWFDYDKYLSGKSWVTDCRIVTAGAP